jgi:hypothetical protein
MFFRVQGSQGALKTERKKQQVEPNRRPGTRETQKGTLVEQSAAQRREQGRPGDPQGSSKGLRLVPAECGYLFPGVLGSPKVYIYIYII